VHYRPTPDSDWKPMPKELAGRTLTMWFFDTDNNTAYAEISDKGEPAQLYKINLSAGTRERLGGQPNQEATSYERAGRKGPPVLLKYSAGKPKIDYLDPKSPWVQLHAGLMKAFPGEMVSFVDLTRDEQKLLFMTYSDRNPGTYYLFDRTTNKPSLLFKSYEHIDPAKMAPTTPLEYKNRNGDTLFAFLTTPPGKTGNMPLVVMPHGGPIGPYDTWSYDSDVQFLASLGYAVLRVNYRGSGARGDAFMEAGYRKWGTGIQDDITDGVKFVIDQGLVDKDKICIYGASFGGYSAMMNPIRNPGMYKCAIGYAGVYDLVRVESDDDSSKQSRSWLRRAVGSDKAELLAHSPSEMADKLDVPMLLIHGKSDYTAPIAQYNIAEAALKKAGVAVESLVMADEGHGFHKRANQEAAYNRIKDFLLKYNPPN
jgi:dipeptidyl aminopeptidase/acylaminoacyl peptidase